MKRSAKDKVKGKFHEIKGKVKTRAGRLANNPRLEVEGRVETAAGKAQKAVGKIEKAIGK